jgi:hypothetical protein
MVYTRMMNRIGTLRNEDAKRLVPTTASYGQEVRLAAETVQKEILYENNPELYGTCVICNKPTETKGDHYVSAIKEKLPRFRNNYMLAINHPMNMVYCCKGRCNEETKKMLLVSTSERHKNYYNYVLENCPIVKITMEQYVEHDRMTIKEMESRASRLRNLVLSSKSIYTEDIDAE